MSKGSFAVKFAYGSDENRKKFIILGVTSIMPNLNGFLFNTEDHQGFQVESHEIQDELFDHIRLMSFYYDQQEVLETYVDNKNYTILDHRLDSDL